MDGPNFRINVAYTGDSKILLFKQKKEQEIWFWNLSVHMHLYGSNKGGRLFIFNFFLNTGSSVLTEKPVSSICSFYSFR